MREKNPIENHHHIKKIKEEQRGREKNDRISGFTTFRRIFDLLSLSQYSYIYQTFVSGGVHCVFPNLAL